MRKIELQARSRTPVLKKLITLRFGDNVITDSLEPLKGINRRFPWGFEAEKMLRAILDIEGILEIFLEMKMRGVENNATKNNDAFNVI